MSAKYSIATQTCELSKEEFNDFLTLYPILFEYRVILPKYIQTIFDAPPGFIYLGLTLLVVPSSPFLLSCARLMVVSPLSTSSKGSSICVELCLGRYPTSVRVFPDPILFLAGLKPSWEYGHQRPAIMAGGKDDDDSSFLPKEPSLGFGIGFLTVLVNTKPLKADEEFVIQPVKVTADSRESPKPELFVVHPGSVVARIKDRKCKNRGGLSRPPVNRKLAPRPSTSHATRAKTSSSKDDVPNLIVYDDDEGLPDVHELNDATACHRKISAITPPAWKNHLHNHIDVELLYLYDRCYARQVVVENTVNMRSCELFQVIKKPRGEFDVMRDMERARRKSVRNCGLN
nr:hypothetical protein [Tanacetum cinerariifolium]